MGEDRDHLVKFVFPRLRKLCEERGVTWGEVDLRWGIPDEDSDRVLPLCLEQIKRCRPYFIGLLGERYGFVPERIAPETLERFPWLATHPGSSITELEIVDGVLRNPEMNGHAFFYFRDPGYLDRLPAERKRADFEDLGRGADGRLARLKERIRDARDEGLCRLREEYRDPEQLGAWLYEDLADLVSTLFPEQGCPDPLDVEAGEHEAWARNLRRAYVERPGCYAPLDAYVAGDGPPLVVLGESGVGKSALLANWAARYRAAHSADVLLLHFIGATPSSADASQLMRRIMHELKRRFGFADAVPSEPERIRTEFAQWMVRVPGSQRVVLVLDGLNQLVDRDAAPELGWLPSPPPPNWRLIASTLPGRSLEAVLRRGWTEMVVEPLSVAERRQVAAAFLARYGRRLGPDHMEQIIGAEPASNPLFLRTLLDELRQFGEHERLSERLEYYLAARNPRELYERVLARWEQDFGVDLVGRSLTLIWAARRGLSEAEILDLLGDGRLPMPQATWTPLYLAAETSFAQRAGLLAIAHDYLRAAVRDRYLGSTEARMKANLRLAAYFEGRLIPSETHADELAETPDLLNPALGFIRGRLGDRMPTEEEVRRLLAGELSHFIRRQLQIPDRNLDELAYQWQAAEEWERLRDLLGQSSVFAWFRSDPGRRLELNLYWLAIGPRCNAVDYYQKALESWEIQVNETQVVDLLHQLGMFHAERAEYLAAEPLLRRAVAQDQVRLAADDPDLADELNSLASVLVETNRLAEAEPLLRQTLASSERRLPPDDPEIAHRLGNLAQLLSRAGRRSEAEPMMRRALAISEARLGPDAAEVAHRLGDLAILMCHEERHAEAEPLLRRALEISERQKGLEHPDTAVAAYNLAGVLRVTGRLAEAEALTRQALATEEKFLRPNHPSVSYGLASLAEVLRERGRLAEAEELMRRALAIAEASLGPEHPDVAQRLDNLAVLLQDTERPEEAEPLLRRVIAIDQAGEPDRAMTARHLADLALLLGRIGRSAEVPPLLRQALAIEEAVWGPQHPSVATTLNALADALEDSGDPGEAESLLRRAVAIDEAALGPEHSSVARDLHSLGTLLYGARRLEEAEQTLRRALAISERATPPQPTAIASSMDNLGVVLAAQGRYGEAEPLLRRALELEEAARGPDHPDVATRLNNLGQVLHQLKCDPEAEPLLRRALEILLRGAAQGGDEPPHLREVVHTYALLLSSLRVPRDEINTRLQELEYRFGIDVAGMLGSARPTTPAAARPESDEEPPSPLAAEFRRRVREELSDIRRRSEERGKLVEMELLEEQIIMRCAAGVMELLVEQYPMGEEDMARTLRPEIVRLLKDNPLRSS